MIQETVIYWGNSLKGYQSKKKLMQEKQVAKSERSCLVSEENILTCFIELHGSGSNSRFSIFNKLK